MASSAERQAFRDLGALLTGTEARLVSQALVDGSSVSTAFAMVESGRRYKALSLVKNAGLSHQRDTLAAVLTGIEGARSHVTRAETLWTMPGHVAGAGALTSRLVDLVARARTSVVCSTFNIQKSSGMWQALREVAHRPHLDVRVYLDGVAAAKGSGPTAVEIADWLSPATVLISKKFGGKPVRNHAKFLAVDHRWLVVTSANLSWSAEYANVELGVRLDDPGLTERVEREMRDAEDQVYQQVADR
ncbi:DISARM system phospholipase D-like protein DrmC [Oerskovia merdavium]|uniref:Phospholipase n=1 Tax=Oerskovia merdavium TaxID=2762227 RepID=A0ABR8TYV6_9CELL|nr:DISARM system phospholipase D-like protein DrmC [Oerskovia merdavium]MBD7980961.1 phospholipase [Oerskovia merdavium]